ncbi:MAG: hypothetical protein EBZ07_08625, partial [Verrucomicrobia bacterium]|nr:hypothetical protein [Verrucomicrobiota bacterium]
NLYVGEKVDSTYLGRGEVNQSGGTLNSWYVFVQEGTYNLNGGTLSVAGVGDGATNANGTLNFNGGVLRGTFSNANFLVVDTATVQSGGAIFDTQGYDLTTSQPLAGPGGFLGLSRFHQGRGWHPRDPRGQLHRLDRGWDDDGQFPYSSARWGVHGFTKLFERESHHYL